MRVCPLMFAKANSCAKGACSPRILIIDTLFASARSALDVRVGEQLSALLTYSPQIYSGGLSD
ncbi:hypothetical protein IAD21_06187 [Abditibacteriota bacterium]|nr:hypothetical protein IAD21_06187 [Abditibacteriota bacterium]